MDPSSGRNNNLPGSSSAADVPEQSTGSANFSRRESFGSAGAAAGIAAAAAAAGGIVGGGGSVPYDPQPNAPSQGNVGSSGLYPAPPFIQGNVMYRTFEDGSILVPSRDWINRQSGGGVNDPIPAVVNNQPRNPNPSAAGNNPESLAALRQAQAAAQVTADELTARIIDVQEGATRMTRQQQRQVPAQGKAADWLLKASQNPQILATMVHAVDEETGIQLGYRQSNPESTEVNQELDPAVEEVSEDYKHNIHQAAPTNPGEEVFADAADPNAPPTGVFNPPTIRHWVQQQADTTARNTAVGPNPSGGPTRAAMAQVSRVGARPLAQPGSRQSAMPHAVVSRPRAGSTGRNLVSGSDDDIYNAVDNLPHRIISDFDDSTLTSFERNLVALEALGKSSRMSQLTSIPAGIKINLIGSRQHTTVSNMSTGVGGAVVGSTTGAASASDIPMLKVGLNWKKWYRIFDSTASLLGWNPRHRFNIIIYLSQQDPVVRKALNTFLEGQFRLGIIPVTAAAIFSHLAEKYQATNAEALTQLVKLGIGKESQFVDIQTHNAQFNQVLDDLPIDLNEQSEMKYYMDSLPKTYRGAVALQINSLNSLTAMQQYAAGVDSMRTAGYIPDFALGMQVVPGIPGQLPQLTGNNYSNSTGNNQIVPYQLPAVSSAQPFIPTTGATAPLDPYHAQMLNYLAMMNNQLASQNSNKQPYISPNYKGKRPNPEKFQSNNNNNNSNSSSSANTVSQPANPSGSAPNKKNNIVCFFCNQAGHLRNECPALKKQKLDKANEAGNKKA